MDFSDYPLNDRYYSGSEKKLGITIDGCYYMLKFQKQTAFGMRFNHISEYIGSHIFELLGFLAQETYLGTYKGEQVVACKDFIVSGKQFVPFNDVGESTLDQDKEKYQYEYEDIMQMLRDNAKLTDVKETISMFWEMFIVDALIGNFDRHGANWGFVKKNNAYSLAPIFDNGSCLYPNLTDEVDMQRIINSEVETEKRISVFPTSQIKLNGKKSSYYDVIHSMAFPECNQALRSVFGRIDLSEIFALINETPLITETHKAFYRHMLQARCEKIIRSAHDALDRSTR
jgi:hypothetical protein